MFRFLVLMVASVFWLTGVNKSFGQACEPSADVSQLCNAVLGSQTTSYSYSASTTLPASVPVYVPPTYIPPSSGIIYRSYYRSPVLNVPINHAYYRTPVAGFDFSRAIQRTPATYYGSGSRAPNVTILNGVGGQHAPRSRPANITIVNNLPPQRAGGGAGGLVRGIGGAVSDVIDSVGRVANSPAGLVAIGAGIGGAGPLRFLGGGGGGGGNGLNTALNFQAAQNRGLSPQAAAVFAASQKGGQGRGRGR